jgi:hypothetical protein
MTPKTLLGKGGKLVRNVTLRPLNPETPSHEQYCTRFPCGVLQAKVRRHCRQIDAAARVALRCGQPDTRLDGIHWL